MMIKNNERINESEHDSTINVLISTFNERINAVPAMLFEEQPDVKYIISHQYTDQKYRFFPELLDRDDVILSQISGRGLSRNRNNALSMVESGIAIIADDDVRYLPDSFQKIRAVFQDNPDTDLACFKIQTCDDEPAYKRYPDESYCLNFGRKHYLSSIEITFRIKKVKNNDIFFDERFGAGSERIPAGEEEAFIQDCLAKNLNVCYYPFFIVQHSNKSSTKQWSAFHKTRIWIATALEARKSMSKAIWLTLYMTTRQILLLLRNRINPFYYIYESFSAIWYILKTNK